MKKFSEGLEKTTISFTKWVGSTQSLFVHTFLFVGSFVLSFLDIVGFEPMLLFLTTVVSLEAIYLSIFIQMSINHASESLEEVSQDLSESLEEVGQDIDEIHENIGEIQEDMEEINEDEEEEDKLEKEQKAVLDDIRLGLAKLASNIEKLSSK